MKALRIFSRSLLDFFKDDGFILASSISYFMMMALVPFCLFMITLFGHILGHYPEFYSFFLNRLVSLFPAVTAAITDEIVKLVSFKGIGKFSLLLYGILSYQVFAAMEYALNRIFKVGKKRHVFFSILISLVVITLITALFIAAFTAASLMPLLMAAKHYIPFLKMGKLTAFFISYVLPFFIVLITVTVVYILLPNVKIRLTNAFRGALFTTVLLEVAKHVFTWYVLSVVQLGRIYGPLTAIIVFLLWIFYSSSILLIGAEIVHNLNIRKT